MKVLKNVKNVILLRPDQKRKNPACVDVCNARALDFGELDDLKAKYAGAKSVGGETKASTLIIKK